MECDITSCEYMQLAGEKIEKYESESLKIQGLFCEIDKISSSNIPERRKMTAIVDLTKEIRKRVFELSKI